MAGEGAEQVRGPEQVRRQVKKLPVRVGILGGGQLARMLASECQRVGGVPYIFASKSEDCALEFASHHVVSDGSKKQLVEFCRSVDVLTVENEFFDLEALRNAAGRTPVYPRFATLELSQSKLSQKRFFLKRKIAALPFVEISTPGDLKRAFEKFGTSVVLKKERFGYDGKGTFIFRGEFNPETFAAAQPKFVGYAEPLAKFKMELAVILTRSIGGKIAVFPVVESSQGGGICQWTIAPARVSQGVQAKALAMATKVMRELNAVGTFGVELFLLEDDRVVVNEIAPRVHNTGHFTLGGCSVSQFEQHLRAVMGLPLMVPKLLYPAVAMVNILGGENVTKIDAKTQIRMDVSENDLRHGWIFWYGKSGLARGRKLGHVTATGNGPAEALRRAWKLRRALDI